MFPVDGSHWINMKVMIEELHARGHRMDVIRSSTSWYIKDDSPHYNTIVIELKPDFEDFLQEFLDVHLEVRHYSLIHWEKSTVTCWSVGRPID